MKNPKKPTRKPVKVAASTRLNRPVRDGRRKFTAPVLILVVLAGLCFGLAAERTVERQAAQRAKLPAQLLQK